MTKRTIYNEIQNLTKSGLQNTTLLTKTKSLVHSGKMATDSVTEAKWIVKDMKMRKYFDQTDATGVVEERLRQKLHLTDDDFELTFEQFVGRTPYSKVSKIFSFCEKIDIPSVSFFIEAYKYWEAYNEYVDEQNVCLRDCICQCICVRVYM